jgi:hypothetical protein
LKIVRRSAGKVWRPLEIKMELQQFVAQYELSSPFSSHHPLRLIFCWDSFTSYGFCHPSTRGMGRKRLRLSLRNA